MVAVFFGGCSEQQKFGRFGLANRREAAYGEMAGRERAGLVEDERINLRGEFDVGDVLDSRIPNARAAESAATIAGRRRARMNAHGQDTTNTAMTRLKSCVNAQTSAPMTSTSGV